MLFVVGLPIFQIILFCLTIGKDPIGLHLAIVNQELSGNNVNCSYVPPYKVLKPCGTPANNSECPFPEYDCVVDMLSCQFLESLAQRNQKLVRRSVMQNSISKISFNA